MKKSERDELPPARQPDAVSTYDSEVARGTAREKAKADRRAEALRRLEAELTQMEDLEAEHDADPVALPEGALIAGVAKPTRGKAAKHK